MFTLAKWDRKLFWPLGGVVAWIWSHELIARLRFAISVPLTFLVYLSPFTCYKRFYPSNMRPEVVLAARWCHRQILMSPIDSAASVFCRWSVDVFRLGCTVKKLFDIFGCAYKFGCEFAFETNFCNFNLCNDPVPQFYYCTLCTLSICAFWAIKLPITHIF
jgi:hypothetical protein